MQNSAHWINYADRLNRVLAYIYDHLDEEIDLNRLAEIACLSPYHWHRIYHALHGETLAATVKRLRLHRAAGYLAQTGMPLDEVAARSGYGNLQSFTRIFSAVYGMPPAQYRKRGSHAQFRQKDWQRSDMSYDIEIRDLPALRGVGIDNTGSYMLIGRAFDMLYGTLGARGLFRPEMQMAAIYFDDPTAVAEDALRSRACVTLADGIAAEPPLIRTGIRGGRYAVLHYTGPYADMRAAYLWLYGEWLLQSGEAAADAPIYEVYLNNPRDTAPADLRTDICLPLQG